MPNGASPQNNSVGGAIARRTLVAREPLRTPRMGARSPGPGQAWIRLLRVAREELLLDFELVGDYFKKLGRVA